MTDDLIKICAVWRLQADAIMDQLECSGSEGHAQQLLYVLRRLDLIWSDVWKEKYTQEIERLTVVLSQHEQGTIH